MRRLILIVHTSLDGFVAGVKGELDGFEPGEENLQFVCRITETADAALFGRVSYELLNHYWPTAKDKPNATTGEIAYSNWYNKATKIVLSKTLPNAGAADTVIITDNVQQKVDNIKRQPGKDILVFGSPTAFRSIIQLVDDYWIFINPVLFGSGIPLFSGMADKIKLVLSETKQFSNGEIALHYTVS